MDVMNFPKQILIVCRSAVRAQESRRRGEKEVSRRENDGGRDRETRPRPSPSMAGEHAREPVHSRPGMVRQGAAHVQSTVEAPQQEGLVSETQQRLSGWYTAK